MVCPPTFVRWLPFLTVPLRENRPAEPSLRLSASACPVLSWSRLDPSAELLFRSCDTGSFACTQALCRPNGRDESRPYLGLGWCFGWVGLLRGLWWAQGERGACGGADAQRGFWRVGMLGVWEWGWLRRWLGSHCALTAGRAWRRFGCLGARFSASSGLRGVSTGLPRVSTGLPCVSTGLRGPPSGLPHIPLGVCPPLVSICGVAVSVWHDGVGVLALLARLRVGAVGWSSG